MSRATFRIIAFAALAFFYSCSSMAQDISAAKELATAGKSVEAMRILLPLANAGSSEAQRLVGEMCYNGQGVKKNAIAARAWNGLAASSGDPIAQYNMGYLYERGEGGERDIQLAVAWYQKAALQNYTPAQLRLGEYYETRNVERALYWLDKARELGDERARARFSQLAASINEAKRAEDEQVDRVAKARQAADAESERLSTLARMKSAGVEDFRPVQSPPSAAEGYERLMRIHQDAVMSSQRIMRAQPEPDGRYAAPAQAEQSFEGGQDFKMTPERCLRLKYNPGPRASAQERAEAEANNAMVDPSCSPGSSNAGGESRNSSR